MKRTGLFSGNTRNGEEVYTETFGTNLSPWVIIVFFVSSRVHHMDDVVNGDGRLCNVSGEDDLPLSRRWVLEHRLLVCD